jgi:hypothetical protein
MADETTSKESENAKRATEALEAVHRLKERFHEQLAMTPATSRIRTEAGHAEKIFGAISNAYTGLLNPHVERLEYQHSKPKNHEAIAQTNLTHAKKSFSVMVGSAFQYSPPETKAAFIRISKEIEKLPDLVTKPPTHQ